MSKKSKVTINTGGTEYVVFVDTENLNMATAYIEAVLNRYASSREAQLTATPEVSDG